MKNTVTVATPFGPLALIWSELAGAPRIVRILLSSPAQSAEDRAIDLYPEARASSCAAIAAVAASIRAFLEGEEICFSLGSIDLESCPPFSQAVLRADHGIPRGRVSAYGLIAERVGAPGAARAVGNALANNPFPIIVPCHRVIRADRSPGGFTGGGVGMKMALLRMEGIDFDGAGRAIVAAFFR